MLTEQNQNAYYSVKFIAVPQQKQYRVKEGTMLELIRKNISFSSSVLSSSVRVFTFAGVEHIPETQDVRQEYMLNETLVR